MKIVHIITGLDPDGAETMMANLVCQMDRSRFRNEVISLTGMGVIGLRLIQAGIKVRALGLSTNPLSLWRLQRLIRWLRDSRPAVIQTWMYHADLIGGVATRCAGTTPVIWGIHHTDLERGSNKKSLVLVARVCAWLSHR